MLNRSGKRMGIPWGSSGQDSAFSLPGSSPWTGNQDPTSCVAWPKESGETGHPCFIPDLRGHASSFSLLSHFTLFPLGYFIIHSLFLVLPFLILFFFCLNSVEIFLIFLFITIHCISQKFFFFKTKSSNAYLIIQSIQSAVLWCMFFDFLVFQFSPLLKFFLWLWSLGT